MIDRITGFIRYASKSDFVEKVGETAAYRGFMLVLGLANSVVVARFLGPAGRGFLAVATTFQGIGTQVSNLGLHTSNTYLLARKPAALAPLTANSIAISVVCGGGGAAAALAYLWSRSQIVDVPGPLLALALISVPVFLALLLFLNLLLGLHEVRWFNRIESGIRTVSLGLIIIAAFIGWREPVVFFGCSVVATVIGTLICLKLLTNRMKEPMRFSWDLLKDGFGYGIKSYLASLFVFLLLKVDILLVNKWRSAEEAGLYSVAAALADLLLLVPVVVSTLLFPKLAAEPDLATRWRNTRKVLFVMTGLLGGVIALAILLARPAIGLLYGHRFLPSAAPFFWLLPGVAAIGISNALGSFVAADNIPMSAIPYTGAVLLLNVLINIQLIPTMGMVGAAIASSICYAALLPFNIYHVRRVLREAR